MVCAKRIGGGDDLLKVSNIICERRGCLLGGTQTQKVHLCWSKLAPFEIRNVPEVPWKVTEHKAAVKVMSSQKKRELRHEEYLLMFVPFCSSRDLFGFVQPAGHFPEPMALR